MGYAIKKDATGWRSVNSSDDVMADETYSSTQPAMISAPLTREQVEEQRLRAYADPLTGSDRYFAEAARILAMGGTAEEAAAVTASGAARSAEIQSQYPWPFE